MKNRNEKRGEFLSFFVFCHITNILKTTGGKNNKRGKFKNRRNASNHIIAASKMVEKDGGRRKSSGIAKNETAM